METEKKKKRKTRARGDHVLVLRQSHSGCGSGNYNQFISFVLFVLEKKELGASKWNTERKCFSQIGDLDYFTFTDPSVYLSYHTDQCDFGSATRKVSQLFF